LLRTHRAGSAHRGGVEIVRVPRCIKIHLSGGKKFGLMVGNWDLPGICAKKGRGNGGGGF